MDINYGVTLELEIERVLPGGLGLAHAEGFTIFVALAAPGDLVKARIDRVRGRTAFASIEQVVRPSALRIEPPCPYFGSCGGCDFQHLDYESQLQLKSEIIRDCLYRIARIEKPPVVTVQPSPKAWRYRARANWQIDAGAGKVGYFERGTHNVCDVADCAVLVPELQKALEDVRAFLPDRLPQGLQEIEVAAGDSAVSFSAAVAGYNTNDITRRIGDEVYTFNASSFFQTNTDLLAALVSAALTAIEGGTALDFYCGAGLFTIPLARRNREVIGVEAHPAAAKYARRNLSDSGLKNVRIVNERVADWLRQRSPDHAGVDFVILDPPRTGAEPGVVERIISLRPRRISYVSCDPSTLARDLKIFSAGGYEIASISAFDMFPQTHHVETVVHLTAKTV